jgi:hypothetical protein
MGRSRSRTRSAKFPAPTHPAEIVREYGPFEGAGVIHGVTHDRHHVWAAVGSKLTAFDPGSGRTHRTLDHAADAGTAFDGAHLYQIAEAWIDKIDRATGEVVASTPAPGHGHDSGLVWAEGACGSDSTAIAGSTRSIRRRVPSSARSSPTALSRRDLGRRRALARYLVRRRQRDPAHRSGSGTVLERLEMPDSQLPDSTGCGHGASPPGARSARARGGMPHTFGPRDRRRICICCDGRLDDERREEG